MSTSRAIAGIVVLGSMFIGSMAISNNTNERGVNQSVVVSTYTAPTMTAKPTVIVPTVTVVPTQKPTPTVRVEVSRGSLGRSRLEPQPSNDSNKSNVGTAESVYVHSFRGNITMYTLHPSECGKYPDDPEYGVTSSGVYVREHRTVAAGWNLPYGTKLRIEGFADTYVVEDRGGGVGNNCIDIYTSNKRVADEFGRQFRKVYVLSYGK